jgi:hypothetical protein
METKTFNAELNELTVQDLKETYGGIGVGAFVAICAFCLACYEAGYQLGKDLATK